MRRAARASPPAPTPFFPEGLPIRATYSSRGGGGGGGVAFGSGPTRSPRARRVIRRPCFAVAPRRRMETLNVRTEPDCFQGVSSRFSSRPRSKARCSVHQSRRPMMDASPRSDTTVGRASSSTRVSSSALERARRPSVPRGREDASAFVRGARGRRSRAGGRAREGGSPRASPDLRASAASVRRRRTRTTRPSRRGFRARRHRPPPPRRVSPAATRSSTVVFAIARAASACRSLSRARGVSSRRVGDDEKTALRCRPSREN